MLNPKKHRTLVLLSGGVDSTATLWYILNHSDEYGDILIHHIHLHNVENRWKPEAQAVKAILAYVKKYSSTPFISSESVIAVPNVGRHFLYDVEAIGFITGYITSRDPSVTKVAIGVTSDDWKRSSITGTVAKSKSLHNAFHINAGNHSDTVKVFPLKDMTKQQAYESMPPELARLTWSCRTPREMNGAFIECGRCKACRGELQQLKRHS